MKFKEGYIVAPALHSKAHHLVYAIHNDYYRLIKLHCERRVNWWPYDSIEHVIDTKYVLISSIFRKEEA